MNTFTRKLTILALTLAPTAALAGESTPPAGATGAPKKIQLDAGLIYGMPQGDFKSFGGMTVIGSSPGLVLGGGYEVIPHLSVVAELHYFKVSSEVDGVDLGAWDIGAGARYAYPVSPVLSAYGEGIVERAAFSAKAGGSSSDSSGIGFAVGGGVMYAFKPNVSFGGGLSYSTVSLKPEQGDSQSSGWLSLNAFAMYHM